MTEISSALPPSAAQPPKARDEQALRDATRNLEASFLAEMLKSAGLGKSQEAFGGGVGEDQFSSFLVQAQADQMAKRGGIGLAEMLYNSMKGQTDAGN